MRRTKVLELSILFGMITATVLSVNVFSKDCNSIRGKLLRMHVIANSDTHEDQDLKLKVRDAVLEAGKEYFNGSSDISQAEEVLNSKIDELEKAAEKAIIENGYDYNVKINIGKSDFSTVKYENNITLPAGEYEAVNVVIGAGEGHNWWCVMFPPMCLPAAENDIQIEDVLTENELKIVESDTKLEPRFKIIEIIEKIKRNL